MRSLFTDEQRAIVNLILGKTVAQAEENLLRLYNDHASLLHFLHEADVPQPSALAVAAGFAANAMVRRALAADPIDAGQLGTAIRAARDNAVELDRQELGFVADSRMRAAMAALQDRPKCRRTLENALEIAEALRLLPFLPDIWQAQNIWHKIATTHVSIADPALFEQLGRRLAIDTEAITRL